MESAKDVGKNVEVNEYQEALNELASYYDYDDYPKILQELVDKVPYYELLEDKAIPKKPIKEQLVDFCGDDFIRYSCPICNYTLKTNHSCSNNSCRQAIDWSEDER